MPPAGRFQLAGALRGGRRTDVMGGATVPHHSAEYAAAYRTVVPGVHVHEPAVKAAQMLD
jgi:hypothetical protein